MAAASTTAVGAQSPGSSSPSSAFADSYIGSLISLTSKSAIRYEGVLFNISTQESSIGLRNVRSFGTEGRKKDGPQIPPSDKVYEYILFRGSDIKDLQVKSSPLVQTSTPVDHDPAIIQTHYSQSVTASANLPSSGIVSMLDVSAHTPQMGLPRPTFQSSLPLYQPVGSLGSWGPSPPTPTTNGNGFPMTMYWQGFSGSSNGFQPQQKSLLMPPPSLTMPHSMQQPMPYPIMNPSFSVGSSAPPTSIPSESPSSLLPPLSTGTQNLQSSMLPAQSPPLNIGVLDLQSSMFASQPSAIVSESPSSLIFDKASTETLHTAASSASFPLVSPLTTALDKPNILLPVPDKPKTDHSPLMQLTSESVSSMARTSSPILNDGTIPPLITPGQLLKSGPTIVSSSQPSQAVQKDVEVVQVTSSELPPSTASKESQEPILPLPAQFDPKLRGARAFTHQGYRGGRERGRGNRMSRPVTRFTEDFDFTAMNEKFNKDEVWGDLGKSNKALENACDSDTPDENDVGASPCDIKTFYVKDDFFDSLSCDALDRGMRNGRTRFSEQLRKDTETFGYSPRHRGGRGRRPGRGGRWSGSYYGSGYGNVGRGRGHNFSYRAT